MTTLTIDPAIAPPVKPADDTKLVYDGTTGSLFILWLEVLGLTVITLGFYRFWGRTRIRKYLWSHVSLLGERFEYDGTGGELFRRFLVAAVIFGPILFAVQIATFLHLSRSWVFAFQGLQVLAFVYLSTFALYAGRRYRLSRTLWRGIRGGLGGSGNIYALKTFGYFLLWVPTLGLSMPWMFVNLYGYQMRNSGFGDEDFVFTGKGRRLFGPYIAAIAMFWGLIIGLFLALTILNIALGIGFSADGNLSLSTMGWGRIAALAVLGYAALIVAMVWPYLYFNIRALRYFAESTRFRGVTFSAPVKARSLLWLQFGNFLIMMVTLGSGSAFTAHRYVRFFCNNLHIHGAADLEALSQEPGRRRPKGGEGLVQLLDTGGFA